MAELDEYQRRVDAWIARRFECDVHPGTGRLETDCAAYSSGGWATIRATWCLLGFPDSRRMEADVVDDAWSHDFGWLIRELIEIELPDIDVSAESEDR